MKYKYITSVGIVVIVLFVSIMSIVTPDREISDLEGRALQKLPTPKNIINKETFNTNAYLAELLSGHMFKKWDSYFSDHIYNRDGIVNTYADIQDTLDKKYLNGAYIGHNEYIFSPTKVMGMEDSKFIQSGNYFNDFSDKFIDSNTYIVNLPEKDMVYEKELPVANYKSDKNDAIDKVIENIDKDKINVLDFRSRIKEGEDLFYKTDHHWNMNGTYKAYEYIINHINKDFKEVGTAKSKDEFEIKKYENYFVGSDGRKVGQLVDEAEDLEVYYSNEFDDYKVYNQDGEFELLHNQFLDKDKFNNDYSVYLGGDHPEIKIENPNADNELKIVMIGDSMDNPLVTLMASHFNQLYSYDLRLYQGDIINDINDINPDIIMLIGLSHNFIEGSDSSTFKW